MSPTQLTTRARLAVLWIFAANGAIFASLASRFPDIKVMLGLTPGQLGATLLVGSLGAVVGLPLAGPLNQRFGAAHCVRAGAALIMLCYGFAGLALTLWGDRTLFAIGLFGGMFGMGLWDVSMNLEGATVEKREGRTIMPWFHAAFSGGTVIAALLGALASALKIAPATHFVTATALMVLSAFWLSTRFLPRGFEAEVEAAEAAQPASSRSAWLEPRTLLVGVMVLVAAFTEGTANDWVAVALHEGYHLPTWAGVLGFAVFLTAMTLGRILGASLIDRHGRVGLLRVLFLAATVGSLLVVFGGPWLAFLGAAIWGIGASLGFPVGMSAAADDPRRAAARMSVVSTIGYVAFLAGPPALGALGDRVGVLHSLLAVGAMAVIAMLVVPAAREPQRVGEPQPDTDPQPPVEEPTSVVG